MTNLGVLRKVGGDHVGAAYWYGRPFDDDGSPAPTRIDSEAADGSAGAA